jgi:lipopolysaccharide export system permease protein
MRIFKKVDRLVITSFFPPFVLAFFIAVFVLIMQFLWSFIDELVGKGISTLDLAEMLFYRSLSLFPLAFPIGILLAAVMVFGGLSERYELSSFKSAGVSLLRVMAPAILFSTGVALFSIFCSNTLIPLSNLKFQSRLYDMRNKKPALNLAEGVFNDDFKGYSIHIAKKNRDNKRIEDVVIYDQTTANRRQFSMVTAKRGEMFISDDKRDFVMKLYDGYHYQEMDPGKQGSGYPFTRTLFSEWTKKFSLHEFDLSYTDEDLFKSHHTMKSVGHLIYEIDTIDLQRDKMLERNLYDFRKIARHKPLVIQEDNVQQSLPIEQARNKIRRDTVIDMQAIQEGSDPGQLTVSPKLKRRDLIKPEVKASRLEVLLDSLPPDVPWDTLYASLPVAEKDQYVKQALAVVRTLHQSNQRVLASLKSVRIGRAKHVYELHSKFCFAVICIIFLFIGAPMGAIVRKGGFGYPLLVAVIFFTVFILLTLMFKKLSEAESVDPTLGAWMPCIVLFPISLILTYKALNDAKMLNLDPLMMRLLSAWNWLRQKTAIFG